jgi:adenylate cyclase
MCLGCWSQMHVPVPIRGLAATPFRAFGIRPSRMNPNICNICETTFEKRMKARRINIDATVLFADLRNYTGLSQFHSSAAISTVLDAFYEDCAESIWEQDGLVNKTMGDAVMAIFNFPIGHQDHARRAILAARRILERWNARRESGGELLETAAIGVGIDCGEINFGEFGGTHSDVTAIGTVVNRASRVQAVAAPNAILVTEAVRDRARAEITAAAARDYPLKGFADPVTLWAA